ncbi:MAG: 1-deoxy-D-xylulose-5-phosphate reductoisomerase [Treponema sp.]|nr:1-deoxy-D-xylulose-5-phosphate reductoisomerase [Treponema sp.]
MKKRIAVLGATGSIGKSALDVISRDPDSFEVVLLSAHTGKENLDILKKKFPCALPVLTSEEGGKDKLLSALADTAPDITVNGISGAAGLEPTIAAINAGSHVALANKESIVMAGQLVKRLAEEKRKNIIPVDSEHSAVFHLLRYFTNKEFNHGVTRREEEVHLIRPHTETQRHKEHGVIQREEDTVKEIILTASGGPFRNLSLNELENVTVKDALAHPTWNMGKKITIDSASMANKGLEIIEACVFFNMPSSKVKAVIHPQSIVHSMITLCNGVIYAQLSKPDMRHPIHDALYWPVTTPSRLETISFDSLCLEFYKPDTNKFPMLNLAWKAAEKGALYPCVYNSANEIAVSAFLEEKIKFTDIPKITEHVLEADWSGNCLDLETVLKTDKEARNKAINLIS